MKCYQIRNFFNFLEHRTELVNKKRKNDIRKQTSSLTHIFIFVKKKMMAPDGDITLPNHFGFHDREGCVDLFFP